MNSLFQNHVSPVLDLLINLDHAPRAHPDIADDLAARRLIRLGSKHAVRVSDWEPLPRHLQWTLRCVAIGRELYKGVLIARSAGLLHGLWTLSVAYDHVHIAVPGGHSRSKRAWPKFSKYHKSPILPDEIDTLHGARVTTRARTCVDIARFEGFRAGLAAMDSFLRTGGRKAELRAAIERARRCKGIAHARRAYAEVEPKSESPYESYFRAMYLDGAFPSAKRLTVQGWVEPYRVDFIVNSLLIVEIDGDIKYQQNAQAALVQERKRERDLTNKGYRVIRFDPMQLLRKPDECIRILEQALKEQASGPRSVA